MQPKKDDCTCEKDPRWALRHGYSHSGCVSYILPDTLTASNHCTPQSVAYSIVQYVGSTRLNQVSKQGFLRALDTTVKTRKTRIIYTLVLLSSYNRFSCWFFVTTNAARWSLFQRRCIDYKPLPVLKNTSPCSISSDNKSIIQTFALTHGH